MANRLTVNGIMRIFFSMVIKLSLQKEWVFSGYFKNNKKCPENRSLFFFVFVFSFGIHWKPTFQYALPLLKNFFYSPK